MSSQTHRLQCQDSGGTWRISSDRRNRKSRLFPSVPVSALLHPLVPDERRQLSYRLQTTRATNGKIQKFKLSDRPPPGVLLVLFCFAAFVRIHNRAKDSSKISFLFKRHCPTAVIWDLGCRRRKNFALKSKIKKNKCFFWYSII